MFRVSGHVLRVGLGWVGTQDSRPKDIGDRGLRIIWVFGVTGCFKSPSSQNVHLVHKDKICCAQVPVSGRFGPVGLVSYLSGVYDYQYVVYWYEDSLGSCLQSS